MPLDTVVGPVRPAGVRHRGVVDRDAPTPCPDGPVSGVERRGGPVDREQALATLILCGSGVVLVLWAVFII
jgi:hypothetical protein